MPDHSRINPLSSSAASTASSTLGTTGYDPNFNRPIQSITMGIRIGKDEAAELGYVQSFAWNITRGSSELYQIEPVPDATGLGSSMSLSTTPEFLSSKYWPGEVIEVIPGKQGAASLTLSRCTLYSSSLLSALMYLQDAGNIGNTPASAERQNLQGISANEFRNFVTLVQQVRPVYVKQIFLNPISGKLVFGRVFEECWIEDMKENIPDASENKVIIEEMTLKATRIRPLDSYTA